MLKKCFIKCLYLFLILVFFYTNICYATVVAVTNENLKEALQNFVSSKANKKNYNISVSDNVINLTVDNKNYILNYDLTDKPTFSSEVLIEKGMSYEEYDAQTSNLSSPMLGYLAVANIQGAEFEDAMSYFSLSYAEGALNGSHSSENSYIIYDDTNMSDGVTIIKDESDSKTIYVSEFGERVMEYVNYMYPTTQTISDSKDINSYVMTIEKQDVTETSCKLVSTLSVNLDADFSELNGFTGGIVDSFIDIEDSFIDNEITKENADYVITLKVGQKCKIETTEEFNGYEVYGGRVEIDEELAEITAIKEGNANGYFYIGDKKKTFYITVEENTENETLETIILQIETTTNLEKADKIDNTVTASSIPKAGSNNTILFITIILVLLVILIEIKVKKYENIR